MIESRTDKCLRLARQITALTGEIFRTNEERNENILGVAQNIFNGDTELIVKWLMSQTDYRAFRIFVELKEMGVA